MKYLLMIMTALALVGSTGATSSPSLDCCTGGACCMAQGACCAK